MNQPDDEKFREEHAWAIKIVRDFFSAGLEQICDSDFLRERYKEFVRRDDPVFTNLLRGMEDLPLEQTFVSYFTVFQTLATQSRFWLDESIARIVTEQAIRKVRPATEVYSSSMLRNGSLKVRRQVADLGECEPEQVTNQRAWKEVVQKPALERIDLLVGEEERLLPPREEKGRAAPRTNKAIAADEVRDCRTMDSVVASLSGPPGQGVKLQCNLLVIEPNKNDGEPHAWAIRYVNQKTFARHDTRKQERVNVLRLYALLVQEKILRNPRSIHVCVAELMPRRASSGFAHNYPDYFSTKTYWSSQQLWDFIGIPFGVVELAIQDVAKEFRERLKGGLRGLLPG